MKHSNRRTNKDLSDGEKERRDGDDNGGVIVFRIRKQT